VENAVVHIFLSLVHIFLCLGCKDWFVCSSMMLVAETITRAGPLKPKLLIPAPCNWLARGLLAPWGACSIMSSLGLQELWERGGMEKPNLLLCLVLMSLTKELSEVLSFTF